jgi:hypothetical protein
MTAPAGIEIGALWTPKRGRQGTPVTIRQIHRRDKSCAVLEIGATKRTEMTWADLRKGWRPA